MNLPVEIVNFPARNQIGRAELVIYTKRETWTRRWYQREHYNSFWKISMRFRGKMEKTELTFLQHFFFFLFVERKSYLFELQHDLLLHGGSRVLQRIWRENFASAEYLYTCSGVRVSLLFFFCKFIFCPSSLGIMTEMPSWTTVFYDLQTHNPPLKHKKTSLFLSLSL